MSLMITDNSFLTIQSWMLSEELGLKSSNELMIYALIHGFSQDGVSCFYGSLSYIMKWTKLSEKSVLNILQSLTKRKLIIKRDVKSSPFNNKKARGSQHFCLYYTAKSREKIPNKEAENVSTEKFTVATTEKFTVATTEKFTDNNIIYNNINLDNIDSPLHSDFPLYENSQINNNLNSVGDISPTNLEVIQKDLNEINNNLKTNISEKEKINNLQDNLDNQNINLNTDTLNLKNKNLDKQSKCLEILKNKKIDTSQNKKISISNTLKSDKTHFNKIDYDECRKILFDNREYLISQNKKIDTSEFDYKVIQRWLKNCFLNYGVEKTKIGLQNSVKDEWLVNTVGYAFTALFSSKIFPRLISNSQSEIKKKYDDEKHHTINFSDQDYSVGF